MLRFLQTSILTLTWTGSIGVVLLLLLLRPFQRLLSGRVQKLLVISTAILFLIPANLLVQVGQAIQLKGSETTVSQHSFDDVLRDSTVTGPIVRAGEEIGRVMPPALTGQDDPSQNQSSAAPVQYAGNRASSQWDWTTFGLAVYGVGVLVSLVIITSQNLRLQRKLRKSVVAVVDAEWIFQLEALCKELHIRKQPRLVCSTYVSTPMITGVIRPILVLPVRALDSQELNYAIRHELTHCKHHDLQTKLFLMILSAIHWFNPMVYLLRRKYEIACEHSCDEAVTRGLAAAERGAYASTLLTLAVDATPGLVAGFGARSPKAKLKARLIRIVRPMRFQKSISTVSVMVLAVLTSAAMLVGCGVASVSGLLDISVANVGLENATAPVDFYNPNDQKEKDAGTTATVQTRFDALEFGMSYEIVKEVLCAGDSTLSNATLVDRIETGHEYENTVAMYAEEAALPADRTYSAWFFDDCEIELCFAETGLFSKLIVLWFDREENSANTSVSYADFHDISFGMKQAQAQRIIPGLLDTCIVKYETTTHSVHLYEWQHYKENRLQVANFEFFDDMLIHKTQCWLAEPPVTLTTVSMAQYDEIQTANYRYDDVCALFGGQGVIRQEQMDIAFDGSISNFLIYQWMMDDGNTIELLFYNDLLYTKNYGLADAVGTIPDDNWMALPEI